MRADQRAHQTAADWAHHWAVETERHWAHWTDPQMEFPKVLRRVKWVHLMAGRREYWRACWKVQQRAHQMAEKKVRHWGRLKEH